MTRAPVADSQGPDSDGNLTIPDLFAMSNAQALEALRSSGHQGSVSYDDSLCGSVVAGRVIERGQVCHQHPAPGTKQRPRLSITIRLQSENPWVGNEGKPTEWRLMPNLIGLELEKARAEMTRVGFDREDRIQLSWLDDGTCQPNIVCKTYPEAMERFGVNSDKIVVVGRPPPPPTPAATPTPEPQPAQESFF